MNYDTASSIFDNKTEDKGHEEWQAFHVEEDKVSAFKVASPRSTYEPRYVNIIHINRYRTT